MSSVDALPPDQRAVLQLVLQRGRSYDEIASLLSIERGAVRQRALDALASLAPGTVMPAQERALITDYLLGQLPERVAGEVVGYLASAPTDRGWALAVSEQLSQLSSGSLPEIPVGAPLGADIDSADDAERVHNRVPPQPEPRSGPRPEPHPAPPPEPRPEPRPGQPPEPELPSRPAAGSERPRGSRRGGAILLAGLTIAVIVAIVLILAGGGNSGHRVASDSGNSTSSPSSTSSTSTTQTTSTTTTAAKPKLLAALNLTSPSGASNTAGIAQVVQVSGVTGIVIDAQGMPANTAHDAYGVWLYNSASSSEFVGFVPNLVGKNGKLQTEGKLPAGATKYKQLLITLETQRHPRTPGQVVLSGPFREHP